MGTPVGARIAGGRVEIAGWHGGSGPHATFAFDHALELESFVLASAVDPRGASARGGPEFFKSEKE